MTEPIRSDIYADFSEFYDLYVGDWLDDLPCYLAYAAAARMPVLEIGAGTGRLTVPLQLHGTLRAPQVQLDLERVLKEGLDRTVLGDGKSGILRRLLKEK